MKCLAAHIARAILLTAIIFWRGCWYKYRYKRSKYQPNRTTNKWVIKSQNIGYSSPILDSLFESNATSPIGMKPVPDERPGATSNWGHWTKILSLVFEFWALKVDIYQCLNPNNLLRDSPIFPKNIFNCKYGPKVSLGTIFNPIGEGLL